MAEAGGGSAAGGGAGRRWLGVVGAGGAVGDDVAQAAFAVGRACAQAEAVLVCGGLGGVMEAACRGARSAGGLTVGLLPGTDRAAANEAVAVALPTGLGELRNGLIVRAADALVAIGGEWGTLSEIALALKAGKPVVGLASWELARPGIEVAADPADAVARALAAV